MTCMLCHNSTDVITMIMFDVLCHVKSVLQTSLHPAVYSPTHSPNSLAHWFVCLPHSIHTRGLFLGTVGSTVAAAVVTRQRAGRPEFDSPQGQVFFLFATASSQALGSTQLPMRLIPEAFYSGAKRQAREAEHLPHLVPKLRTRGAVPPQHHTS